MSIIAINVYKLPLPEKTFRGQDIITKSQGNPNVPGNAAALAAFSAAQADLLAAINALDVARSTCDQLSSAVDDALGAWSSALTGLAAFTENATGGDRTKILSTGFDVRGERTPPQPLAAPANLTVRTNGSPGTSKLSWRLSGADTYIVECSMTPEVANSWEQVLVTTKTRVEIPGAEPGKACWFRVAGVNPIGQGPWCTPAQRPVM